MRTKVTKGTIELVSPLWTRYHVFHSKLELDVCYTEVFLNGVREPIEVPGALSDNLVGRAVQIIETYSRKGSKPRIETIRYQIFSNPHKTLLYDCSFKKSL